MPTHLALIFQSCTWWSQGQGSRPAKTSQKMNGKCKRSRSEAEGIATHQLTLRGSLNWCTQASNGWQDLLSEVPLHIHSEASLSPRNFIRVESSRGKATRIGYQKQQQQQQTIIHAVTNNKAPCAAMPFLPFPGLPPDGPLLRGLASSVLLSLATKDASHSSRRWLAMTNGM